jgi:hypothetical protein
MKYCGCEWETMDENEKEGIHRLDILTETQDMVSIAFACQFCQLTGLVHNITLVLVQQPVPLGGS